MDTPLEVEARVSAVKNELRRLDHQRNNFRPIMRLPNEVLVMVLKLVLDPDYPKTISSLMSTCRHLHAAIADMSCLWTKLHYRQKDEWWNLCFQRSHDLPLDISFDSATVPTGLQANYISRAASLHFDFNRVSVDDIPFCQQAIDTPAPMLTSITILGPSYESLRIQHTFMGGQTRFITNLEFRRVLFYAVPPLPVLRNLTLHECRVEIDMIQEILRNSGDIRSLTISEDRDHYFSSDLLETLGTHKCSLPRLDTLIMTLNRDNVLALASLCPKPGRYLSLSITEASDDPIPLLFSINGDNALLFEYIRKFWAQRTDQPQMPSITFKGSYGKHPGAYTTYYAFVLESSTATPCLDNPQAFLYWRLPCIISHPDPLISLIDTMVLEMDGDRIGLHRHKDVNFDLLLGVNHLRIANAFTYRNMYKRHGEDDLIELQGWLMRKVQSQAGRLKSLTFEQCSPLMRSFADVCRKYPCLADTVIWEP
jgi:hypothetical protein